MASETTVYTHKGCGGVTVWDLSGGYCIRCGAEGLDPDAAEPPQLPPTLLRYTPVWVTCQACGALVPDGGGCGECGRPL
jgi:hypothetical protein